MARLSAKQKAEYLGTTPKKLDRELRAFSRAARLLWSNHPRLIEKHPKQWVALYDGKVRGYAKSLDALIAKLERQGLPPNEAIIRYIDTSGRKLIL